MNSTGIVLGFQYKVLENNDCGDKKIVKEVFVPSHKIIMNANNHYFYGKQPRHDYRTRDLGEIKIIPPLKEIEVPLELVEKIAQILKNQEVIRQDLEKLWI